MKCRDFTRLMSYGQDNDPALRRTLSLHAQGCAKCRRTMTELVLWKSLLASDAHEVNALPTVWEEARLVSRVKASIHAARENTVASWETAVISIRGWLGGFAAAAALLLALSGQLATIPPPEKSDSASELVSSVSEANHELANPATSISEELISSKTQNVSSDERGNLEE